MNADVRSSLTSLVSHAIAAAASSALVAYAVHKLIDRDPTRSARESLPRRIILLRHGESEGNADHTLYRTCPDNQIELTDEGSRQAQAAGRRIKKLIGEEKVDLYVSPFQRTLQTSRNAILAFSEGQVQRVSIDPRIREQEFGNLQGDDFKNIREEQTKVGRFWYRFPTGESGGDVYDRAAAWWETEIMSHNLHPRKAPVDNVLVVTHGLAMRLILMQLFGWSPDTFHTVWNACNCSIYVLRYDACLPGRAPYRLDLLEGDEPASSKEVTVTFKEGQGSLRERTVVLTNYLSIPQPRTEQSAFVLGMLKEQHEIPPEEVERINFFPTQCKKFR